MTTVHPFDLQARIELAIHALTALRDGTRQGQMYFLADWRARPPRADHGLWDCGDGSGRATDALSLARRIVPLGSPAAARAQADLELEAWMLRLLGVEGLSWLPEEPWASPWGKDLLLASPDEPPGGRYAEISWAQRGTLMGLISRFLTTGEEGYLTPARRLVDRLLHIAVRHADGLFFPEGYYRPGGWHTDQTRICPGIEETNAAVVVPAQRLYEIAGYAPALELADGLMRFALKHTQGYSPDGRLHARQGGTLQAHFHTRSAFILGTLKLGLITGRRELVAWARQSYHFAGEWGAEFGWFPEHLGQRHGEICGTVDMIEIALLLGRHVDRAYYADVERFGRNHLLESQWLGLEQLRQATARLPEARAAAPNDGRYSTREGVIESQVGGFASRPALNDAFHADATDLMQCCNASGLRALCDLWTHAVEHQPTRPDALPMEAVHLHFSVETPSLRVVSYVPAQGRLDLLPRHDCRLAVRLPCGEAQALVVRGSDTGPNVQALRAEKGYIELEAAAGKPVEVHFHLPERVAHYQVGSPRCEARCVGTWRGETLMRVEPAGQYAPLYDRRPDTPPVQPTPTAGAPILSL